VRVKSRRRVTIKRIAHEAGVSLTTVSRALNDRPDIDPATRQRILALADELGYTPSAIARSLVTQRSHTIGLAVRTLSDLWAAHIVLPIEELAHGSGYDLFISTHHADADWERRVLRAFHGRQVDGIIVVSSVLGEEISPLQSALGIPIVLISPLVEATHRYVVRTDDVAGARSAVEHLIRLGHRRIAHIGAPDWAAPGLERRTGYRQALEAHGIAWDPALVYEGDAHETGGLAGVQALLQLADPPTAFSCFNDMTAVGAVRGARLIGHRVPEDLSVVGFDDMPLASYVDPPLTTVRQDLGALGGRATQMLLNLIAGQKTEAPVVLGTELVERTSCAEAWAGER
jgi:DNA-binding LacI/PurR family transcriptional regulator